MKLNEHWMDGERKEVERRGRTIVDKMTSLGFPGGSGKESINQCRKRRFDP